MLLRCLYHRCTCRLMLNKIRHVLVNITKYQKYIFPESWTPPLDLTSASASSSLRLCPRQVRLCLVDTITIFNFILPIIQVYAFPGQPKYRFKGYCFHLQSLRLESGGQLYQQKGLSLRLLVKLVNFQKLLSSQSFIYLPDEFHNLISYQFSFS